MAQKRGLSLLLENSVETEALSSNGRWVFRETALTLWDRRREAAVGGGALDCAAVPRLEVDLKAEVAIFIRLVRWEPLPKSKEAEMKLLYRRILSFRFLPLICRNLFLVYSH